MRAWHWYSGIFWGQVRENGKRYFLPPLKKPYETFTMQTYVLLFSYPCVSPSIKSEHGSLVSQGSNINVKEIHTHPHITWIWNSQMYLFQYSSWNFPIQVTCINLNTPSSKPLYLHFWQLTTSKAALKVCVCCIQPHSLKTHFNIILTSMSTF